MPVLAGARLRLAVDKTVLTPAGVRGVLALLNVETSALRREQEA